MISFLTFSIFDTLSEGVNLDSFGHDSDARLRINLIEMPTTEKSAISTVPAKDNFRIGNR
jgi:hypothetical protein